MTYALSLEQLSRVEPWRLGKGQPRNALDPTWSPSYLDNLCGGEIQWQGGTRSWVCMHCGYVGSATVTMHKPIQHPLVYFAHSLVFFMKHRSKAVPNSQTLIHQLLFVAGAALRYAAVQEPGGLGKFVDKIAA